MKELRWPSAGRSEIRILLVFDPWRSAILLVAGDKSGQWDKWYRAAIPAISDYQDGGSSADRFPNLLAVGGPVEPRSHRCGGWTVRRR